MCIYASPISSPSDGLGHSNCGHNEDAGVKCSGPDQSKRCFETCIDGFYAEDGKCRRCSENCLSCLNQDVCSSCKAPFFLDFTKCVLQCPEGQYGDTNSRKCQPCDPSCQTCMDGARNNICRSCHKGQFLSEFKFPFSLTRNITSHSMKNLAFHSLLR